MSDVGIALVQALLLLPAGAGLWMLWREFAKENIAVGVVAAGFGARAIGSSMLFWISWTGLPIASGMHFGGGFWFFGPDGRRYFFESNRLLTGGGLGFLSPDTMTPAYVWVQLLTLFRSLFGTPASVALLANLGAYLVSAILVARWAGRSGQRQAAKVALVGLSLQPSFVLWVTQPLKDTFFLLVVVAFAFCAATWFDDLVKVSPFRLTACSLALVLLTWLLLGVRPEYRVVLWAAFVPSALWAILSLMMIRTRNRRKVVIVAAVLALAMIAVAAASGWVDRAVSSAQFMIVYLDASREGFERRYDPSTLIEPGPMIDTLPQADVIARGFMTFVPRFVTRVAGLATADGGRGLWWFAELDTVFFGLLVCWVAFLAWKTRPPAYMKHPAWIFLLLLFLGGLPMLYTVNNFGTLMRFRMMLELPILLMPLVLGCRWLEEPGPGGPCGSAATETSGADRA